MVISQNRLEQTIDPFRWQVSTGGVLTDELTKNDSMMIKDVRRMTNSRCCRRSIRSGNISARWSAPWT